MKIKAFDARPLPLPNIATCLVLDAIGMFTYAIPFAGELADVIWAPLSAFIFYTLFGGRIGLFGGMLNFIEELFPFTDVIPSFTIAWCLRRLGV
jgi:hypothetical protein